MLTQIVHINAVWDIAKYKSHSRCIHEHLQIGSRIAKLAHWL